MVSEGLFMQRHTLGENVFIYGSSEFSVSRQKGRCYAVIHYLPKGQRSCTFSSLRPCQVLFI